MERKSKLGALKLKEQEKNNLIASCVPSHFLVILSTQLHL